MRISFHPFHSSAGEWRIENQLGETVLEVAREQHNQFDDRLPRKLCMLAGNAPRMLKMLKRCRKYLAGFERQRLQQLQRMVDRLIDDCTKNRGQYDDK